VDEDQRAGAEEPGDARPAAGRPRPESAESDSAGPAAAVAAAEEAADPTAVPGPVADAGPLTGRSGKSTAFEVHLEEFQGPFDLLLSLIAKHKLDVTTLSLSTVTDEFIAFIHAKGTHWDLDQASEFLLIAATLLDLKAARLLPSAEVEDEEDLALLEARDLLFARLMQYRAYKQVATELAQRFAAGLLRYPRQVPLEQQFKELLPETVINLTPEQFVRLAVRAMTPRLPPTVSIEHIHQIQVSVREQANILADKLRLARVATFRALIADAPDTLHIVARFLALLELFRDKSVGFDQVEPFADLTVRWTGSDAGTIEIVEEFDGAPVPADAIPVPRTQEDPVR
jgi:segregation and condensation protein A